MVKEKNIPTMAKEIEKLKEELKDCHRIIDYLNKSLEREEHANDILRECVDDSRLMEVLSELWNMRADKEIQKCLEKKEEKQ